MNNLLSYCGLVDEKIRASSIYLPLLINLLLGVNKSNLIRSERQKSFRFFLRFFIKGRSKHVHKTKKDRKRGLTNAISEDCKLPNKCKLNLRILSIRLLNSRALLLYQSSLNLTDLMCRSPLHMSFSRPVISARSASDLITETE